MSFLISIREEAYAGLGDIFKRRIANVYGDYLHVDYLDRAAAEDAIRKPLAVSNQQPGIPARPPATEVPNLIGPLPNLERIARAQLHGKSPAFGRVPPAEVPKGRDSGDETATAS